MKSQCWLLALLLAVAIAVTHWHGNSSYIPERRPLADLPSTIDQWNSSNVPLTPAVLARLGSGSFLNRIYTPTSPSLPVRSENANDTMGLFIAYYPSQPDGTMLHSPQFCLPGAGWSFDQRSTVAFRGDDNKLYNIGSYLISSGHEHQEVLYWYRAQGHTIAEDNHLKFYSALSAIRKHRTDAGLIRIITPLKDGESQEDAQNRAVIFARKLIPLLSSYIPD